MLITKEVEMICKTNKKYYINKGYNWEYNKTIKLKVNDLPKGSHQLVEVLCDYCLKEIINKEYRIFIKHREDSVIKKDCCKKCSVLKVEEGNLLKFGVRSTFQIPNVMEKRKITMIELFGAEQPSSSEILQDKRLKTVQEKYGVDNVFQLEDIKQKRKISMEEKYGNEHSLLVEEIKDKKTKTIMDKFGVEHAIQNKEVKDKREATNITKYGFLNPLQNEIIKEKSRKTLMRKYGVENFASTEQYRLLKKVTMLKRHGVEFSMQNPDILAKARKTMFENGNTPCSTQQKYLHQLLGGELNYPISNCSVDIAFPEEKIYVEYNGSGHDLHVVYKQIDREKFNQKEIRRYKFLMTKGYNGIFIISKKDKIPYDNVIVKMIKEAKQYLNTGHSWIEFDIDNQTVKTSLYKEYFDFGKLRKIIKDDLIKNII